MAEDTLYQGSLANGLQVLLKEVHTAPLVSHWVWYRVGSRDEVPGRTGASHWVEHMLFKGTERYPAGVLDRVISRVGGVWNALTYLDWTTYFETLPAEHLDLALDLESDRMVHARFAEEDVEAERTVIISERQGNENDPLFRLSEEVQAAAFRVHAYHHEVIGDMADLQTMGREDLYQHYRTYYGPNNAVLALAGDFRIEDVLPRIERYFGPLARIPDPPRLRRPEPPQSGERRIIVEGAGETTFVQLAYRAPRGADEAFMAYFLLDSLLTGPSNLNFFGTDLSHHTSRLYRRLVDGGLAVSVSGSLQATIDPYLYWITLVVHPDRTPDEVIQAVEEEIQRLQDSPPPPEELERARKQAKALFAYNSESITAQAFWLGYTAMFADYAWAQTFISRIYETTAEQIQAVAQRYLRPQQRVTGIYVPTGA
ncbi:MAG: insulinase family protein [Chloroflexi bacterium]|nr:insulinase family protein [Chloroflexota bacterium]